MIAPRAQPIPRSWGSEIVDRRLWYLLAGTRGGLNRARILWRLHERPRNANDLAGLLGLDYKTVRHHLDILRDNDCIMALGGEGYGMLYGLSPRLQTHFEDFLQIWTRLDVPLDLGPAADRLGALETAR